ncbi:hypothetical protein AX768_02170 [Burkholderia sp. PAMC 28687]|uniref:hypothetical protein n=1 Tax=Burkholderia sp. PAMC 28687 TaxID=1795874 RepID=UPI0007833296|nr:hypothetical protein [Burkholderia sp. PAMC 28687]AMM13095.1 hypothetical protein AX768_02170 [Burkholderia sp. PAMC 28687]
MPKKPLPHFAAVDLKEMRRFWKLYRGNEDVERLLLEIQHNRNLIYELEDYFPDDSQGVGRRGARTACRDGKNTHALRDGALTLWQSPGAVCPDQSPRGR